MQLNDRIINIVEDYESIVQTLAFINTAISNDKPLPNYIPVFNELFIGDYLSNICEYIQKMRDEKNYWYRPRL